MKELSIEEKAKAYDEAIKKVNDYYEGKAKLYSDVDKTLDYLFPELKESEDEKIRKEMLAFFKHFSKNGTWKPSDEQMDTLKQWLKDNQYKGDARYCFPILDSLYQDLKKLKEE